MKRIRVIPVLLINNRRLVKTVQFKNEVYIGDPVNALKIFNDKCVDEILILDISRKPKYARPDFDYIRQLAGECFMPMAYGGGIADFNQAEQIFQCGVEKVVLNSSITKSPKLISDISFKYGAQSVVASIDIKKNWLGKEFPFIMNGTKRINADVVEYARNAVKSGAGEVFINFIDRDGMFSGYDLKLINRIAEQLSVPLVACGGAESVNDFYKAAVQGASAVAAGSMFVFKSKQRGILINYPDEKTLMNDLYSKL